MEFDIQPLSKKNLNDFLSYFEKVEFKDHPHWGECYCYSFHFTGISERWVKERNRSSVCELVNAGKMTGYLAYYQGVTVGWCNANNRLKYQRLLNYYDLLEPDHKGIFSIVCFLIHPDYRRKGIATQFLHRIESDSRRLRVACLEGYPTKRSLTFENQYMGPLDLFMKNGFDFIKEYEDYYLVRKSLQ